MHKIGQTEFPRAITASLWNAAVAIGLVIGLALPVAGSPVTDQDGAAVQSASVKTDVAYYDNYVQLVKRAALLRVGASDAEAADIVTIQQMLAGYRELHAQAVALHRAGDVAEARRMAGLCSAFLEEIRHTMTQIGQNSGIGQDETAPVKLLIEPKLVVAAR
jgi:hypothetical protein